MPLLEAHLFDRVLAEDADRLRHVVDLGGAAARRDRNLEVAARQFAHHPGQPDDRAAQGIGREIADACDQNRDDRGDPGELAAQPIDIGVGGVGCHDRMHDPAGIGERAVALRPRRADQGFLAAMGHCRNARRDGHLAHMTAGIRRMVQIPAGRHFLQHQDMVGILRRPGDGGAGEPVPDPAPVHESDKGADDRAVVVIGADRRREHGVVEGNQGAGRSAVAAAAREGPVDVGVLGEVLAGHRMVAGGDHDTAVVDRHQDAEMGIALAQLDKHALDKPFVVADQHVLHRRGPGPGPEIDQRLGEELLLPRQQRIGLGVQHLRGLLLQCRSRGHIERHPDDGQGCHRTGKQQQDRLASDGHGHDPSFPKSCPCFPYSGLGRARRGRRQRAATASRTVPSSTTAKATS